MKFKNIRKGMLLQFNIWEDSKQKITWGLVVSELKMTHNKIPYYNVVFSDLTGHVVECGMLLKTYMHAGIKPVKNKKLYDRMLLEWGAKTI